MALSVSNLVRVTVNLSPLAAARRSFGILMIAGTSNVINVNERFRSYDSIEEVAADFGTTDKEYLAAALYFGQTPKPKTVMIGRWIGSPTAGMNVGAMLSVAERAIGNFDSIDDGSFEIDIDGAPVAITGLDFTDETNLNGVASVITTALSGDASCTWNGKKFTIISATTGVDSAIGYASAEGTGTDLSAQLKLDTGVGTLVAGAAGETPLECATALAAISPAWYGLMFNASTQPTVDEAVAVAGFIQALDIKRVFGSTITNTSVLDAGVTNDLASQLKGLGYTRSFVQYSANQAAVASFFGRAFSVNFNANRSTITLMYKQEPGVAAENLTSAEAAVLKDKRCNVFVEYVNDTMIIQYGVMSGSAFFDEIHGLDWLQDAIQNGCFNVLYQSSTKIPQTDAGVNQLVNAISGSCEEGVNNGLIAPGVWNADGFGELATGQYLKTGYYIYAQPVALQSQADRETRVAPPIQVAVKLAGAIQEVDVIINVNR